MALMSRAEPRATRCRPTTIVVFVVALAGLSACGGDEPTVLPPVIDVPETVALGRFPAPPSASTTELSPPTVASTTTTTTTEPPPEPITGPIGDEVDGNRVLLIGDTVLQSTSPRADGTMCAVLEAFGWQAEIAAEVGRFVEFGRQVVEARVTPEEPDWDAVVVMLGNHFDGDVEAYRAELDALVRSLAPRPMLAFTLVEDDTFQADLNEIVRALPSAHPNVVVVDWARIAADEPDEILADTPSGLSEEGRSRLALFTAAALGEPPTSEDAGCVPPVFTDDSAIVL